MFNSSFILTGMNYNVLSHLTSNISVSFSASSSDSLKSLVYSCSAHTGNAVQTSETSLLYNSSLFASLPCTFHLLWLPWTLILTSMCSRTMCFAWMPACFTGVGKLFLKRKLVKWWSAFPLLKSAVLCFMLYNAPRVFALYILSNFLAVHSEWTNPGPVNPLYPEKEVFFSEWGFLLLSLLCWFEVNISDFCLLELDLKSLLAYLV